MYAEYLRDTGKEALSGCPDLKVEFVTGEVTSVTKNANKAARSMTVSLDGDERFTASQVVLATGNSRPSNLPIENKAFYEEEAGKPSRYIQNPWGVLDKLGDFIAKDDSVLVLGSRLTAMDVLLTLNHNGHKGMVHMISRHGLLPKSNPGEHLSSDYDISSILGTLSLPSTAEEAARLSGQNGKGLILDSEVSDLFDRIQDEVEKVEAQGPGEWQAVIDSLRGVHNILWQSMSTSARREFLEERRDWWEIRRHRLAPGLLEIVKEMMDSGRLVHHASSLINMEFDESKGCVRATIKPTGCSKAPECLNVDWVVNCTGPQLDTRSKGITLSIDMALTLTVALTL